MFDILLAVFRVASRTETAIDEDTSMRSAVAQHNRSSPRSVAILGGLIAGVVRDTDCYMG